CVALVSLPKPESIGTPMQNRLKHRQGSIRIRRRMGRASDFSSKSAHELIQVEGRERRPNRQFQEGLSIGP
ncbi:MAG: hypothetical protein ACREEP_18760, partial [Dongiaceae bacterium]